MWKLIVDLSFEQKIVCGGLLVIIIFFVIYLVRRKPEPFQEQRFGMNNNEEK